MRVWGKCGIITSDLKSAGSGFCRAKARLSAHRTSENILPLNLLSDDKIRRTAVSVYTDLIYGIITSDLKSAGSGFCRAKARLSAHRTSENILPLNLLSDDKIRRTAVSVYTDLIYGIINFITFVKSLFFQKSACSQSLSPLGHSDSFDSVQPWSFVASASCTDFVRPLVSIHAKAECGATPKARTLWLLAKSFARCKTSRASNAKHPFLKVM